DRARGGPAIPSSQYRCIAGLCAPASLVRAAAVVAAEGAERDACWLTGAVCIGACLWLERAGVAGWPLGFQSVGLAVASRARCVVDRRGRDSPAMGDVTHNARACRPVSAL